MNYIAIAIATVPVVLALFTVVWKMSALASVLTETIRSHKEDLQEIRDGLKALKDMPIMQRDIEQLKDGQARMVSEFPKIDRRLYKVEYKLGITSSSTGMRIPAPSKPDIEGDDK